MSIKKQEKELLKQMFAAPEPKRKKDFLRALPRKEAGLGTLLFSQAAFIRKWVWAVSFLLFGSVVWIAQYTEQECIWVLSAVVPFGALLLILEFARSTAYGMAELEMTSRFSLRTVLLARMSMLGAVQLLGLIPAAFVLGTQLFTSCVYILVPYLLTAVLGLVVVRHLPGREGMFVCGGISAFVCALCPISRLYLPNLYGAEGSIWWKLAAVLLAIVLMKEYGKTMKHLEELTWN
ncbi:MAG: hypothetical protein IKT67_05590 [Lachnospiraceae bacterium]|nr:hypothetical protein [Lachnospiraceae bacterium]